MKRITGCVKTRRLIFMSEYYAHIRRNKDGTIEKQTVEEHCRHTANIASRLLEPIGASKTAYIAGYLHDMGKCKIIKRDCR